MQNLTSVPQHFLCFRKWISYSFSFTMVQQPDVGPRLAVYSVCSSEAFLQVSRRVIFHKERLLTPRSTPLPPKLEDQISVFITPGEAGCSSIRLRLKCDGTRAETRFRLSAKRTSPFKSAGASVQSSTGSRGLRISRSNAGYTTFRDSVKGNGYPLHSLVSPSLPLPCFTVCLHSFNWTLPQTLGNPGPRELYLLYSFHNAVESLRRENVFTMTF